MLGTRLAKNFYKPKLFAGRNSSISSCLRRQEPSDFRCFVEISERIKQSLALPSQGRRRKNLSNNLAQTEIKFTQLLMFSWARQSRLFVLGL